MSKKSRRQRRAGKTAVRHSNPMIVVPPGTTPQAFPAGVVAVRAEQYSGPLPPPAMLREYDEILPGAADRIIRMAENQSTHRQSIEKVAIRSEANRSWGGLACGFVIALLGMGLSAYVIVNGYTIGGSILGGATLTSLVTVFVIGSHDRRKERETKTRILTGTDPSQAAIADKKR